MSCADQCAYCTADRSRSTTKRAAIRPLTGANRVQFWGKTVSINHRHLHGRMKGVVSLQARYRGARLPAEAESKCGWRLASDTLDCVRAPPPAGCQVGKVGSALRARPSLYDSPRETCLGARSLLARVSCLAWPVTASRFSFVTLFVSTLSSISVSHPHLSWTLLCGRKSVSTLKYWATEAYTTI